MPLNVRVGRLGAVVIAGLALAAGGAACGDDDEGSSGEGGKSPTTKAVTETTGGSTGSIKGLEAKLKETLSRSPAGLSGITSTQPEEPAVTVVDCPDDTEIAVGTPIECSITGEQGLSGAVTVTPKSADATEFTYKGSLTSDTSSKTVSGSVSQG